MFNSVEVVVDVSAFIVADVKSFTAVYVSSITEKNMTSVTDVEADVCSCARVGVSSFTESTDADAVTDGEAEGRGLSVGSAGRKREFFTAFLFRGKIQQAENPDLMFLGVIPSSQASLNK